MKSTAVAPANIAFIKYWGRRDAVLRLPYNASISMNLSEAITTTTVEFSSQFTEDTIELVDLHKTDKTKLQRNFDQSEMKRIVDQLNRVRAKAGVTHYAKVVTKNSFPKSTGIASSASGFAALTVAASAALGLAVSEKELTILARLGSGSACRSIPDGFVKWEAGTPSGGSDDSYAHSLYPHTHWDIRDILLIVETKEKDVSSSRGHDAVETSDVFQSRLAALPGRIERAEQALKDKNFTLLGEVIEEDCRDMHAVMQTQRPPLMYWNDDTKKLMDAVVSWRKNGLPVYFTIDAGPNVHIICESKHEDEVVRAIKALRLSSGQAIKDMIINRPAKGAHLIEKHLF